MNPAERSHSELERFHYREVEKNPLYANEGMTGVRLEEIAMNTPCEQDTSDLEDRIGNLEAISAQPGRIPREYEKRLQQLLGEMNFLKNKLNEALDRGKKKAAERAKQQEAAKGGYKGLKIGR